MKKKGPRLIWVAAIPWLIFYTFKAQMLNGYLLLGVLSVYTVVYLIKQNSSFKWKWVISSTFLFAVIFGIWKTDQLIQIFKVENNNKLENLELNSASGNPYFHDLTSTIQENGNLIWIYVQQEEVKNEWEKRSDIAYDSLDNISQPMFGTILRYMTSKDLRKDSTGVWALSDEEIVRIENGMTSINTGYKAKLQEVLYQWEMYQAGGDPNGHSLLQRTEHMNVAWSLVKKNGLFGVGLGDVPNAFEDEYIATNSLLNKEYWHRSHNQFLTIWISHGILGLLMLCAMLFIPLFGGKKVDYFHWAVFLALFFSLFFQDMLETQAGVTIFGLFYGITAYAKDQSSLSSENKESSEEE